MSAKKTNKAAKTPKAKELKDADLDKASGGFTATDDLWVKDASKPLSGTDLGSGRKK